MRILADECIGRTIVDRLRRDGINVVWVAETCPGADDEAVLACAVDTGRVLLTVDKDLAS